MLFKLIAINPQHILSEPLGARLEKRTTVQT